jgi:tetratricopeptide (TPR) repeat protein
MMRPAPHSHRPSPVAFGAVLLLVASGGLAGCDMIEGLIGGGADAACAEAETLLKAGDLPGAADAYAAAAADSPTAVCAATGYAFTLLQQGDTSGADAALALAEPEAGEALPQVKLRRALVALQAGNLDDVATHAEASGLPQGKLLAAEVALADGEREDAAALLAEAKAAGGAVASAAGDYLDLIEDGDPLVAGLSEAQALWALGERKVAVQSVEELVKNLSDERGDRGDQLLIWAGRAASVGETEVARSLLEALIFAPEGQQWRRVATRAIVHCADGEGEQCLTLFDTLEGNAPSDGLADARATAAFLVAGQDADLAKKLASPYISNPAARALLESGDRAAARESAPGGMLSDFLKAGG